MYFNKVPGGLKARKKGEKKPIIIKTMSSFLARALCYSSSDRAAQTLPEHQWSFTATTAAPLQLAGNPAPPAPVAVARAAGLLHGALANSASAPQEALQFLEEKAAEAF